MSTTDATNEASSFDKILMSLMEEYITDYEWEGEAGSYTPNEIERMLIEDCLRGFTCDLQDRLRKAAETTHEHD